MEALESLQWADDPNRSPPGEDEYFQGPGLQDNIFRALSQRRDRSHAVVQQPVADALASAETDKESSGEGSDGGDTELDYEDIGVLPDAEEATADDDVVVLDAHSSAIWTPSPTGIDDDNITNTQETLDEGIKGKKSSGP